MPIVRKHTQNLVIDFISLICMVVLLLTGFLLHLRLPHGSRGATVLSLTRHQWAEVHFWIAIVFTAGIVVHLILHIPWIKSSFLPKYGDKQRRMLLVLSFSLYVLLMLGLGLFLSPITK